ncbi:HAMP domain-containing sensor histidine kinase [Proteiniclasticum sp. QWL-01]|nr:HAMP domain-containing sensor histidine kinase [Proteiniclasticum sp. QWL-01]WFF72537.1 HAMP domain-containing sensor histidine kinase [Proteiniclasticum sp. QWL-01]
MKSKSIVFKLVATFFVILAISYMIIATILSVWVQQGYISERRTRLEESAELIKYNVERFKASEIKKPILTTTLQYLGRGLNDSEVLVLDERNMVFLVSREELSDWIFKVFPQENLERLASGGAQEISRLAGPDGTKEYFVYVSPILKDGIYHGAAVIMTPEEVLRKQISGVFFIIWISSFLALIASIFMIYYFAQQILIRPLYELNSVADKMSKGDFTQRALVSSEDEIGNLANSFNLMAESIENTDQNRRDFISNISHELRSPITSIRGFVAGILDGIIPKDKEDYYLNVVYEEINRLTRLINDLLDLSAMESGRFSMNVTEVDLNEVIRASIVKFETKINDKKLRVDISLDSEHQYVAADRDRLIQVVTNLLDNAVKHSPAEGHVEVSTKVKGKKVTVAIYNDGMPISDADLKNIWSRFYKADRSRTQKESTGLGLPIVRNILSQLGENVWVENRETGVVFQFTLSKT